MPNEPTDPLTPETMPDGDYAIVEFFGYTKLIGRVAEVERFGAKMLVVEPLFNRRFLPALMQGGASIYRLTPVSAEVAFEQHPRQLWHLPESVRAAVPRPLIEVDGAGEKELPF